jgi:hypothetical protein
MLSRLALVRIDVSEKRSASKTSNITRQTSPGIFNDQLQIPRLEDPRDMWLKHKMWPLHYGHPSMCIALGDIWALLHTEVNVNDAKNCSLQEYCAAFWKPLDLLPSSSVEVGDIGTAGYGVSSCRFALYGEVHEVLSTEFPEDRNSSFCETLLSLQYSGSRYSDYTTSSCFGVSGGAQLVRHCVVRRGVVGAIPEEVIAR